MDFTLPSACSLADCPAHADSIQPGAAMSNGLCEYARSCSFKFSSQAPRS